MTRHHFNGYPVVGNILDACGKPCGPRACTRVPGHSGVHVAHEFDAKGRPVRVVATATKDERKPFKFKGVEVSVSDEDACGKECGGYICTRLKGHEGDHIAHIFSENTDKPVGEVGRIPNVERVPMTVLERNVINAAKSWAVVRGEEGLSRQDRALLLAVSKLMAAEDRRRK